MEGKNLTLIKFLLLFYLFISCSKEKGREFNFYKYYSDSNKENKVNIKMNSYILFSKNTDGQICLIKSHDIFYIYKKNNISTQYEDFFNNILSQKILMKIDTTDYVCFKVDNNIESDFLKLKENDFLNRYTVKSSSKNSYLIKNELKNDQLLSVAYSLFKNGFAITYNDYLGVYYVKDL